MIGVVLAGGTSSRFGGKAKGLISLAGRAMALRAADILGSICARVAIEAPRDAGYEVLGLSVLHASQAHAGKGPLAGFAAGLADAREGAVAFAPCDMPLLTREIYAALAKAADGGAGAYATTASGVEPLVAVLNASIGGALLEALSHDSLPRTHVVLDAAGVRPVAFADAMPFANVNAPGDLEGVEARLRRT